MRDPAHGESCHFEISASVSTQADSSASNTKVRTSLISPIRWSGAFHLEAPSGVDDSGVYRCIV